MPYECPALLSNYGVTMPFPCGAVWPRRHCPPLMAEKVAAVPRQSQPVPLETLIGFGLESLCRHGPMDPRPYSPSVVISSWEIEAAALQ
eukprot:6296102-Amphidinium_carterae.1